MRLNFEIFKNNDILEYNKSENDVIYKPYSLFLFAFLMRFSVWR